MKTLDRIAANQAEASRLVSTLKLYNWYEAQGISTPWETIKGIREAKPRRQRPQIDLKLRDGSTRIIDRPPFSDEVIYNRGK